MKKRLFLAINLSENIRYELENDVAEFSDKLPLDTRFLSSDQWHITIIFLGDQRDESIPDIIKAMQDGASNFDISDIVIDSIDYGPTGKAPRMIWANLDAKSSELLGDLREKLEDCLADNNVAFDRDFKKFSGHITLARFRDQQFMEPIKLSKKVNYHFRPASIDLMESTLAREGSVYELLQTIEFNVK